MNEVGGAVRPAETGVVVDDWDIMGIESAPPGGGEGANECDLGGVAAMMGVAATEGGAGGLLLAAAIGRVAVAPAGGFGMLETLAASLACRIRTSGCPDDGPDENRFLSVPKNPNRDFRSFSVGVGV